MGVKIDPFPGELSRVEKIVKYTTRSGRTAFMPCKRFHLTPEQEAWLRKWFPEVENSVIKEVSGMADSTMHRFAREFGLAKSENGLNGIKKRQAAKIKKACEKNGYYESLRGKKPSPQCLEAAAIWWQEVREGKHDAPMTALRKKNKWKYNAVMKRKGRSLSETYRKEVRRAVLGMPVKTRLRIVTCPYTKSQVSHRHNALKKGYIIIDDTSERGGERYNIYWDKRTKRAPIFEKNLIKDGFQLIEWKD